MGQILSGAALPILPGQASAFPFPGIVQKYQVVFYVIDREPRDGQPRSSSCSILDADIFAGHNGACDLYLGAIAEAIACHQGAFQGAGNFLFSCVSAERSQRRQEEEKHDGGFLHSEASLVRTAPGG